MMRGRCGSLEQLRSYIEQHYQRRYRATYTLTDYNLFLAISAYEYGVLNRVGIDTATKAICETYGCSYKRLSNFIRELRLWDSEANDWILPICQKTINTRYAGKKRIETWDLVLDIPHPFLFEVRPIDENDKTAAHLIDLIGIYLDTYQLANAMPIERVSEEVTDRTKLLSESVRDDNAVIEWELSWNQHYEYTSKEYGELEVKRWIAWRRAR